MLYIEFDNIKVDSISNSSGIFTGNNLHINWKASSTSNEGYGVLSGNNNRALNGKSAVIKPDIPEVGRKPSKH